MKPTVFIASSSKGLQIARTVRQHLARYGRIELWDPKITDGLSKTVFENLVETLEGADFGVFIFSPDDVIIKRDKKIFSARDNVVFELGLFTGRMGRNRAFVVMPKKTDDFELPTDLLGHIHAEFDLEEFDGDLKAALLPACQKIRKQIDKQGKFTPSKSSLFDLMNDSRGASAIVAQNIEGLWLSRFEYRAYRGEDYVENFQYNVESLTASSDQTLTGENLVSFGSDNYVHQLETRIFRNFLLGIWLNRNSYNVGNFQLAIRSNCITMAGRHLGNANNNTIQDGDWRWVKIHHIDGLMLDGVGFRLRSSDQLEDIFTHAFQNGSCVELGDIVKK